MTSLRPEPLLPGALLPGGLLPGGLVPGESPLDGLVPAPDLTPVGLDTEVRLADYPPGATFGPRRLVDHEFVWLLEGSAHWCYRPPDGSAEQLIELRPGQLALGRPGARDEYRWSTRSPSRHAYVHFTVGERSPGGARGGPSTDSGRIVRGSGDGLVGSAPLWPLVRELDSAPILRALCDFLVQLAGEDDEGARARSRHTLALLLEVFRNGPVAEDSAGRDDLDPLAPLWRYVRADWRRRGVRLLDADELAGAVGVSRGHLFRLFRERYRCGPTRALELIRLSRAATALQRSNASLTAVADASGFANPYHFSRRFAQTYGCPPGRFRRREEFSDPLAPVREAGLLGVAHRLR